jgi:hypothetical protein
MQSWVDKKGISEHTQLSKKQIEGLMRTGLPFCKLPSGVVRFYVPDVDSFLRSRYQQNAGPTNSTRAAADRILERIA